MIPYGKVLGVHLQVLKTPLDKVLTAENRSVLTR